jgi:pimeloyl-ACP methyl ester carboxylesterase
MSLLAVPGAQLFYETQGRGPLMLLIPGAFGSGAMFSTVAERLAGHYTIVTYDRRGFSRSRLEGPQDDTHRLQTDADDVRRLIEHVSDEPAIVFGTSSGGLVGLTVLTDHPYVVRALLPFEPPAVTLLPDGKQWVDFFWRVYERYRHEGIEPALALFRAHAFAEADRHVMARARDPQSNESLRANITYWFEHELRQYPAVDLNLEALSSQADRIVPVAGWESRGYPCYRVSVELGRHIGRDVIELPGGHVGHVAHPATFARALHDAMA